MAKASKYGLRELQAQFPNDVACLQYLFDSLHTKECSCGGTYTPMFKLDKKGQLIGRKQFQCSKCRFQIAPMTGTIFEKSTSPLKLWFHAIWIFSNAKSGISAKEMERQLNVTYKTAWRFLKLSRESISQGDDKLKNDVEMDEGFFGGKGDGGTYNKNQSAVMGKKAKVLGAIERGGKAKAKVVPNLKAETIGKFIKDNLQNEKTRLLTDESNRYNLVAAAYNRQSVNHGRHEYVRGDVHINNVEGFWSHIKRSLKGTHKTVSKKHLQAYLDGFVWHRNNRDNDRARFAALLLAVLH